MNLLLDSHVLLWWLDDHPALPPPALDAIRSPRNAVCVSAANTWEIAIKQATGKLRITGDLAAALRTRDVSELAITVDHALHAGALPPLHRDPFDRMLVAQAQLEALTIVTVDPIFDRYDVAVLSLPGAR